MTNLRQDLIYVAIFAAVVLTMPIWTTPLGASYSDLLQRFAIYGILAIGFNILFGMTGYLSFGHAAFLGVGSYTAMWSFKLLTMSAIPALLFGVIVTGLFAAVIGYLSLKRSGIYFSILTLAFAQMSYNLAYSVLTPITNGETGLQLAMSDPRVIDRALGIEAIGIPDPVFLGMTMDHLNGFYFCAALLIVCFFLSLRINNSPFGMMLRAIKSNQPRMAYTGFNPRPYTLAAFIISGMYAGLAGSLLVVMDPLAGAERMQWTASGEVVLMTILGGAGTLVGPFIGATVIKYLENIFSAYREAQLHQVFSFLPDGLEEFMVTITAPFVGEGWHLTLGIVFMLIVIFLPGGLMEGARRIRAAFSRRRGKQEETGTFQPAE